MQLFVNNDYRRIAVSSYRRIVVSSLEELSKLFDTVVIVVSTILKL